MNKVVGEKEFWDIMKNSNSKLNGVERKILCDMVNALIISKETKKDDYKPYSDINNIVDDMLLMGGKK